MWSTISILLRERIYKKRLKPLAEKCNSNLIYECDVQNDKSIDNFFSQIKQNWNSCDFLVHSVAFSDKNELKGSYVKTSRENFLNTLNVSCYSFHLCQRVANLMSEGGQILTLSYLGARE